MQFSATAADKIPIEKNTLPNPSFAALSASFWDLTNFDLDLVEVRAGELTHGFYCVRNRFCQNLLAHSTQRSRCQSFLLGLCAEAQNQQTFVLGKCHAGL